MTNTSLVPIPKEVMYRFETINYGIGLDEYDEPIPGHRVHLYIVRYEIISKTPKGVWIKYYGNANSKKFINTEARKQFACKTIERAKEAFIARRTKYIGILKSKISDSEQALKLIENYKENNNGSIMQL